MTSLKAPAPTAGTQPAAPPAGRSHTVLLRLAVAVVAVLLVAVLTVALRLWFLPFLAGLVAGGLPRRHRPGTGVLLLAAALGGAASWSLALLWRLTDGQPLADTARVTAALAGLPPSPAVILTATLILALLQGLCGAWLGTATTALRRPQATAP